MAHVLVIANETAASQSLIDALRQDLAGGDQVTVVAPVNEPRQGYVVYEDTRRASARRRLEHTVSALRDAGIAVQGFVVDCGPVQATKDALAQLEPKVDRVVVSTHPPERSGWMRREVIADIERSAGGVPVTHVVATPGADEQKNVLVIANQTVVSDELMARIRKRAAQGPTGFLIVAPQDDREGDDEHSADRRLRLALTQLRGEGIVAHGQIVHPDPYTAAMHVTHDERVDEIIVSTFPGQRSGWLRRDLVDRLRKDTGVPVDHVVTAS